MTRSLRRAETTATRLFVTRSEYRRQTLQSSKRLKKDIARQTLGRQVKVLDVISDRQGRGVDNNVGVWRSVSCLVLIGRAILMGCMQSSHRQVQKQSIYRISETVTVNAMGSTRRATTM